MTARYSVRWATTGTSAERGGREQSIHADIDAALDAADRVERQRGGNVCIIDEADDDPSGPRDMRRCRRAVEDARRGSRQAT